MGNLCFISSSFVDFETTADPPVKLGNSNPSDTSTHDRGALGVHHKLEDGGIHLRNQQMQPAACGPLTAGDLMCNNGPHSAAPPAAPFAWRRGQQIGQGAYGTVYKALVHATGQEIAVKQVSLPRNAATNGKVSSHIRSLEREVALLQTLRHENIVRYLGTERTDEHLNIFLEYVAGGPLSNKLSQFGPLLEETIQVYTKQILCGLHYLHQQEVMHRDIKGANILVDTNGVVKLADFGASKKIEKLATAASGPRSVQGTAHWMAPEVLRGAAQCASDIWSLACVVIEMATGQPPWPHIRDPVAVMFHLASTRDPPPLPDHLSTDARDFLRRCFCRVPRERPSAEFLLQHSWLRDVAVPTAGAGQPVSLPVAAPAPAPQLLQHALTAQAAVPPTFPRPSNLQRPAAMPAIPVPSPRMRKEVREPVVAEDAPSSFPPAGQDAANCSGRMPTLPHDTAPQLPGVDSAAAAWAEAQPHRLALPDYLPPAVFHQLGQLGVMGVRAACPLRTSTVTLNGYNPVEEPSWVSQQTARQQEELGRLAAVSEHNSIDSPPSDAVGDPATSTDPESGSRSTAGSSGGYDAGVRGSGAPTVNPSQLPPEVDEVTVHVSHCPGPGTHPREMDDWKDPGSFSKALPPVRPVMEEHPDPGDGDAVVVDDEPSPAAWQAPTAADAMAWSTTNVPVRQSTANHGTRHHVSASRRALEEAGILGGTLDASRAKQWREELAEMRAERLRALGAEMQQKHLDTAATGTAPASYGAVKRARPSVADLF